MKKWVWIFVFYIGLINSFETVSVVLANAGYYNVEISLPFICLNDTAGGNDNSDEMQSGESLPDAEDLYTINILTIQMPRIVITASNPHKSIDAFDSEANAATPPPKC